MQNNLAILFIGSLPIIWLDYKIAMGFKIIIFKKKNTLQNCYRLSYYLHKFFILTNTLNWKNILILFWIKNDSAH